jgi:spoIIIJ-associated protein
MGTLEFQGNDLEEAIENACSELGIDREHLEYQVIESKKKGLFSKAAVKISVEPPGGNDNDGEEVVQFVEHLIDKMGLSGSVEVTTRENARLGISINSRDSGLLIGRRGKTLDAIQLIVNAVIGRMGEHASLRVIVDSENYRTKREQKIVSLAEHVAQQVRRTGGSRLLEPMNPFERRIIHTTLNDAPDIETMSEGDGLYKQIRISFKGRR